MSIPLLQTKLYLPHRFAAHARHSYVIRPRLVQTLTAARRGKLTLISAPAGFGKSTLLAEWIAECSVTTPEFRSKIAWLSLDSGDNDPVRFWSYVIAALQTVRANLGEAALALLQAPQPPPAEALLTLLLNDLSSVPEGCMLVLDDYHVIETPAIHEAIAFLLDHLPDSLHLILSSRSDPPLPLARLRARGQLTEIRAIDLRFTPEETNAFLNGVMGLTLSQPEINALETRTEGWVAGLQLAALSLRGRRDASEFVHAFSGSHMFIVDYLAEEVIGRQPVDVQRFLLETSILERMCSSLCDAVTGRRDSHTLLERLQQQNLFVVPLDDERKWRRYHHLFADLLRNQLQQVNSPLATLLSGNSQEYVPQEYVEELHKRAATWYEAAGLADEAIHHTLAAQEFAWAGRLMLQEAEARLARGEVALLLRWLEALPAEWVRAHFQLHILQVALLFLTNRFAEVQQHLPEVERAWGLAQLEGAEIKGLFSHEEIPGLITGLQAEIALFQDDFARAVALSQQALALLDRDILGLRSVIGNHFALHYWVRQQGEQAPPLPADSLDNSNATNSQTNELDALTALGQRAELKRIQGHYREGIKLFRRLLQLATEQGQWLKTGLAHGMLGFLLYEANELVEAEAHARQGIKLGEHGAGVGALFSSYVTLSQLSIVLRNFAVASETIEAMTQLAQSLNSTVFLNLATLLRMDLRLAQGDLTAAQWQQASAMRVTDAFDRSSALVYNRFARTLINLGEVDAAMSLLARLLELFEETQWVEGMIKGFAVQAVALRAQHQHEQARSSLQRALILAEPEVYIRTFVDLGAPMRLLLVDFNGWLARQPAADQQRRLSRYVAQLLGVFASIHETNESRPTPLHSPSPMPSAVSEVATLETPQKLVEPLTARELEVLQLMAAGQSNREMARTLVISLGTVKKHLSNIFGKLAATSRTQALARAKEFHLL